MTRPLAPPLAAPLPPSSLVFTQNLPNSRNAATSILKTSQVKPVFHRDRASCDWHHVTDMATLGQNWWVCWVQTGFWRFPLIHRHSFMTTPPGCEGQWERGRVNVKHLSLTWCTWDNQYLTDCSSIRCQRSQLQDQKSLEWVYLILSSTTKKTIK